MRLKDRETLRKLGICLAVVIGEFILVGALFGGGAGLIPFWLAFGLKYLVLILAPGVSVKTRAFNRTIYTFLVVDIVLSLALLTGGGGFVIIGYALLSSSMLCYLMAAVSCIVIYVVYKAFESLEPKPKVKKASAKTVAKPKTRKRK